MPEPDGDGDGYTTSQGDCNDNNSAIHPGATEICDGIDNNCNTQVDEGCPSCSDCLTDDFCSGSCWPQRYCVSFQCNETCPIVIDVQGNGFQLTDAPGGVIFDISGDGTTEYVGWTKAGSDDAWLALDRNGNGRIDSGAELFGNGTEERKENGFLALAEFDKAAKGGNGDGQIDQRDSIFPSLRLWQDSNHNGASEPGELHALNELGLAVLELDYKESKRTDENGNRYRYRAKVKDIHSAQVGRWAWDVFPVVVKP